MADGNQQQDQVTPSEQRGDTGLSDEEAGKNGSSRPAEPGILAVRERDRLLTETDQTLSDSDQTLSDADQTSSESDQTSADSDQVAADRDQAASDRDLTAGVDPHEHEITHDIRQRTAQQRQHARPSASGCRRRARRRRPCP